MKKVLGALLLLAVFAGSAFAAPRTVTLVLLRHGESVWNLEKKFTGWSDVKLTRKGVKQAFDAGMTMKDAGLTFDVVHTSMLDRAIATAWLSISAMDLRWLPVEKYWRLNERCYGDLEGKTHKEVSDAVCLLRDRLAHDPAGRKPQGRDHPHRPVLVRRASPRALQG